METCAWPEAINVPKHENEVLDAAITSQKPNRDQSRQAAEHCCQYVEDGKICKSYKKPRFDVDQAGSGWALTGAHICRCTSTIR